MLLDPIEYANADFDAEPPPIVFYETPKNVLVAGPGEVLVPLTKGFEALINEADVPVMRGKKFCASKSRSNWYARNTHIGYLHRLICGAAPDLVVDHVNRNSLDCRRKNLRIVGFNDNAHNADYGENKTGFRGVYRRSNGTFYSQFTLRGDRLCLGTFKTAEDAARGYDKKALEVYGVYAWTNFEYPEVAAERDLTIPF